MDKMSGSDLYDYVVRTFKRTDKTEEVYDAITDTLVDMCERVAFEENKVEGYTASGISVLGDYKIDLPSNFGRLIGDVRWSDGDLSWTLKKLSKQQFNEMFPDPDGNEPIDGKPTHYCIFGKQILVGPVPDDTTYIYMLDYSKFLDAEVDATTSDVMFSDNARECIKFGSLARLFELMEEWEKGDRYRQKYEKELFEFEEREKKNVGSMFAFRQVDF